MSTRVPTFCLSNVFKDQLILLPKLSSLPKSDLLIFLTEQLHVHPSHFAHYCHSHSILSSLPFSSSLFLVSQKLLTRLPLASSWSLPKILRLRSIQLPPFAAIACSSSSIRLHPSSLFPTANFPEPLSTHQQKPGNPCGDLILHYTTFT